MPLWKPFILLLAVLAVPSYAQAEDERLEKLYLAVESSDTDEVHKLLKAGVDPNGKADGRELSAFHYALERCEGGIAKVFLNAGADPNGMASKDESALMLAARKANSVFLGSSSLEGVVEAMLERGADLHAHDEGALRMACRGGLEMVKLLIQKGGKPNHRCLAECVDDIHLDIFTHLLSLGLNPKMQLEGGRTLLHVAATGRSWMDERMKAEAHQIWQKCLSLGVPLEAVDADGSTALHLAAERGNVTFLSWLLDQDARMNVPDHQGMTPLMLAARSEDSWRGDCLKPLLDAGAKLDLQDKEGLTVIHHVEQSGSWKRILQVIHAGAQPSDPEALLRRFVEATQQGHLGDKTAIDYARALLPHVKDLDAFRVNGRSLLVWAVLLDSPSVAKELLARGAKVNARDDKGETALDWAVKVRNPAMASFLIKEGAQGTQDTASQTSPLPFAGDSGRSDDQPDPSLEKPAALNAWTAVKAGDLAKLKQFIKETPALLSTERGGLHLVHLAAAHGHIDMLAHILEEAPQERTAKTVDDQSPLQIAIMAGQTRTVLWLIDHPGKSGRLERLHEAAVIVSKGRNTPLLMTLMDSGWSPSTPGDLAQVLKMACYREDMILLERLRPLKPASVLYDTGEDKTSPFSTTTSHFFAEMVRIGSADVVKFLLSIIRESPDLDWQEHLAAGVAACARAMNEDLLKLLLTEGKADINAGARDQETALHTMAYEGRRECAEFLIKHGARPDLVDAKGRTPSDAAHSNQFEELSAWLKEQAERQGSGKR